MDSENKSRSLSLVIGRKGNQKYIAAAVHTNSAIHPTVDLYEFLDNDQLSNIDCLLTQIGECVLYLPEGLEPGVSIESRKLGNILLRKNIETVFVKQGKFRKAQDARESFEKISADARLVSLLEADHSLSLGCLACLVDCLRLEDSVESGAPRVKIQSAYIGTFMRFDSAAADAVNLVPKPDHPSQYGSLFGVLNKCKTKFGAKLLERWLRQPLVDEMAIKQRQDIVSALLSASVGRTQLAEGPLRSIPDIEIIIAKMQGKRAGLKEIVAMYSFATALPKILSICESISGEATEEARDNMTAFQERIITPLQAVCSKMDKYQKLVEHVVDLNRLPDLVVNSMHDTELRRLAEEMEDIVKEAEVLHDNARSSWASFSDLKLERSTMYGYVFRSTRCEDEREFQKHKRDVTILSIKKNGVHLTTPGLQSLASQILSLEREYEEKQSSVVEKALETVLTYISVAEVAAAVVAELDVLLSFSTVAALSPDIYVRPNVLPKEQKGVLRFKAARHPCVELMVIT